MTLRRLSFSLLAAFAWIALALPALPLERSQHGERPALHPTPAARASAKPTDNPGLQYRSIGPAISGGRIAAVAGSNRDSMLYYAGAAGGGVWKSSNGGISWTAVWTHQPFGAIGAVAIDPTNDNVVWAGTGEANPRNDVSWGDGVWRSNDGAKTWQHLGLAASSQIARISIDPQRPRDVLVAALGDPWKDSPERGVFRTRDGGRTWQKTLYADASTGAADIGRDPREPRIVYAALWRYRRTPWSFTSGGADTDGLYRSADGGATWQPVRGNGFPAPPLGRIGLAIAPNRPARVYATVQSRRGTVWRSDDAGRSWSRVSSDSRPEQRPFYFSHLAVDPHAANHVISASMYLTESKDGGRTWKHLTGDIHVDNHALWWSADGKRLINGNDGGIALSNDSGHTWSMPLDLALGQIYHVAYDLRDPYGICGGFQDNSAWCGPSQSRNGVGIIARDWTSIAGGDGTWAVPDPADPQKVWVDTQDGALAIFDRRAQQSIDIEPWPRDAFTSLAGIARNAYRFNWNSPLAFSPAEPGVAYFGGNVVFRTSDAGRTWTSISGDLTRNEKQHQRPSGGPISLDVSGAEYYDTLLSIAPSPARQGTLWTGADDGLLHVTRDGGTTWTNVTPKMLPRYARIESIEPSPDDPAAAYVVANRHDLGDRAPYLFVTRDYGATWRRIDGGLPRAGSLHVVRIDPKNHALLYAGTEQGVWYSRDRGASWLPLQFNLPATPVYDLQIQPRANDLIVATHGRSFWILDDLTPLQQSAPVRGPALYPPRPGTLWAQWAPLETGDGDSLPAGVFVGANPKGPALVTFYQPVPARVRPWLDVVAANGEIVRHLKGSYTTSEGRKYWVSNAGGFNRLAWDGAEDGPTRWTGTSLQNSGPLTGAEALPGTYTLRLHIDGRTYAQPFQLRADPRSPWSAADLAARQVHLRRLLDGVSEIDTLLNAIDAREKDLRARRGARVRAERARLEEARALLTADDLHDEDGIGRPDRLREQLLNAVGALSGSFQPPFPAHRAAAEGLQTQYDAIIPRVKALVRDQRYGR